MLEEIKKNQNDNRSDCENLGQKFEKIINKFIIEKTRDLLVKEDEHKKRMR